MKKLMLCSILSLLFTNVFSQDTICIAFNNETVYEFDYYTSEILNTTINQDKYYDISVLSGDVLCLHLFDEKNRLREVKTFYLDKKTVTQLVKSKDYTYYTNNDENVNKVTVGKPKLFFFGKD